MTVMFSQTDQFIKWGFYITPFIVNCKTWAKWLKNFFLQMNVAFIIRLGRSESNSDMEKCAFYGFDFFLHKTVV